MTTWTPLNQHGRLGSYYPIVSGSCSSGQLNMGRRYRLKLILVTSCTSCFAAILMICPNFSSGVTDETLNIICPQTQNQEICVKILKTNSRTLSATLPQLSLLSINLTRNQTTSNFKKFKKLGDISRAATTTTTPTLKSSYDRCLNLYRLMFQKISEAYDLSNKRKYKEITQFGEAQDLAYRCENGILSNSSSSTFMETLDWLHNYPAGTRSC